MTTETDYSLNRLRARARDLTFNNDLAATAVEVLQSALIGTGLRPKAMAKAKRRNRTAQDLWKNWAETTEVDPEGLLNIYAIQSLATRSLVESGEVLLRRWPRRRSDGLAVPLQIQMLEADHIDTSKSETLDGGNRIIQGVEYQGNRRVAYWLYPDHPGDSRLVRTTESARVPAGDIVHLLEVLRPGQVRGIPRGTPCLLRIRDWDDYADAQLVRQKLAACFVAFVHDIEAGDDNPAVAAAGFEEEAFEPGMTKQLPPGKSVTFGNPPGVEGFEDYARINFRGIASAFRVTYGELTQDYSQENFSSSRSAGIPIHRSRERLRRHTLIPHLGARLWGWMIDAAVTDGRLDSPDVPAAWRAPRQFLTDPAREIPAQIRGVRSGFQSISGAIRELGEEPEEIFDELAEDYAAIDERGLVLETDGRVPVAGSPGAQGGEGGEGSGGAGGERKDGGDKGDEDAED